MARDFEVQIDRSTRGSELVFPQWEKLDKVSKVTINVGRDYESDEIWAAKAAVELEFNSDDTIYVTDDTLGLIDDSYGNGFSYLASEYFDNVSADGDKVRFVNGVIDRTDEKGAVYTVAPLDGNPSYQWRFNFDAMYAALVKPGETYVIGALVEERSYNGSAPAATEHANVYWWTDAGVLVRVDEFYSGTIATTGQTQIKGKVTAPSIAFYATVGTAPTNVGGGVTRYYKYSKFQIHKYDAAYEASHSGNYLKPFVIDNLRTSAPQAGSKIRYVSPGNQFDINRWYPKKFLGANVGQRSGITYSVMPNAYSIDTITTVSDFFTATNATLSLITGAGVISGTKSLNIVTTATSPATVTLGALSTTYTVPVVPGQTYSPGFLGYNSIATACAIQLTVNYAGGSINAGTVTIPASSSTSTYYGWSFTAPAGVYAVQLVWTISGGVRNIVVDEIGVTTSNVEPDPYANKLSYLGDFESITSLTIGKYASSSTSSAFSVILDRNNAHGGNRCLKLTKANASTTANVRFGASSNVFPVYVEANNSVATAGVYYTFSYWAKASAANANTKIQVMYKDNLSQSTVSTTTLKGLTTSWQQYKETIIVKPGATAWHLGIQVVADASPAIDIYIDDLDVRRFTGGFRSDLSSITGNSRISYYDVDTMQSGQAILHYGNDSLDDGGRTYRTYHSGTRRTRFKGTIKSLGTATDAPVGTTAAIAFNSVSGRILGAPGTAKSGYYGGATPTDINVPLTLPTNGGSVSFDVLGPDTPFAASVPVIYMNVPRGAYTIGYEFIGEYIGPDGYESHPELKEASQLTGVVQVRDDSIPSMSTDGVNRSRTLAKLSCTDKFGQLNGVKIDSPYKQTVINDEPLIYLPLDDSLDLIGNLSTRLDVDFSVKTQGIPNNWGVTEDGTTSLAEEGGSLRFENPPLTGLGATQGQVIYGQYDGTLINKYEASYEIWYQRDTTAPDMVSNALFNHNFAQAKEGKIYVWMAGSQLWYKWGQNPGSYQIVEIGEARHDGKPHHVAMTKDKNGLVRCYLDGAQVASFTATERNVNQLVIGGNIPETYQFYAGNLGHFAWYDRALSSDVIANHWLAGLSNRQVTNEVERIKYVLQSAKQPGITAVLQTRNGDMSTGLATLNPASWNSGSSPAELIIDASKSADGVVWAGGDGTFIFENKQSRMSYGSLQNNRSWLISTGDNSIQPEGDYGASQDTTKLVNEVRITGKFNGASKSSTFAVRDGLSQHAFSRVSKDLNADLYDADSTRQAANWDIATHNKPLTRYEKLSFMNQANDVTDDFCRRVQPGDYIHGSLVNGNGLGKGVLNHFVERVEHTIDPKTDGTVIWVTEIEISPAYNQLAWIIEDPIYGTIDGPGRITY